MSFLKKPQKSISKLLEAKGIDTESIVGFADADMNNDCEFQEFWIFFSKENFYVAKLPKFTGIKTFSGYPHKEDKLPPKAEEIDILKYKVSEISEIAITELVTGVAFSIRIEGELSRICIFSSGKSAGARKLFELFEIVKKREEIPERIYKIDERPEFCDKCGTPYINRERRICPKCMDTRSLFMRTLSYFKPYTFRIIVLMFTFVIISLINAVLPYLSGAVYFDEVLAKKSDFSGLWSFANNDFLKLLCLVIGTFLLLRTVNFIITVVQNLIVAKIVPRVVCKIKEDVFTSLKGLSLKFFTDRSTGSLMTRVMSDANEVTGFFFDGLPAVFGNVATLVMITVVMLILNWQMAVMTIVLMPLLGFVSVKLHPRLWHFYGKRHRAARGINSVLNDSLTGVRVIKAFGQEESAVANFEKNNSFVGKTEVDIVKYENRYHAIYSAVQSIMQICVWSIGAYLILSHTNTKMSYGLLATFITYVSQLAGPLDFMSSVFRMIASSMNAAQRIFEIVDARPDVVESANPQKPEKLRGEIELRDVTFSYQKGHPVLNNISFKINEGEMLGIVGRSGVGKSTLVSLISRLYDPDSGEILIDGINLKDLAFESLRGNVAMVSQESYIFMGTVAENIAYAKPDATYDEIISAAAAASAHEFICKMPDGYDTVIGSGGRQLSGGERQRLSVARAILANPKILILDEATASVDTATERKIQTALDKLVEGRTTISIAHRLSTLNNADKLIVLDEGRAVEQGTHEELMQNRGVYYKLVQLQSKALSLKSGAE